ncbi:MAG: (d)CMP kinase [Ignavibacteriae bacterium]|nr:(d)CMP kinase [Ignavibacteriota bacterium]
MGITIALDGPAGSGKSTTARKVAERLGYIYIDTGAMYRAVTLAAIRRGIEISNLPLKVLVQSINIQLEQSPNGQKTLLDGVDVSREIRMPEVTKLVSEVSASPAVREAMVKEQRRIGKKGGVVMDGRDIGTVVFPNAELKVFMIASIDERSQRRAAELQAKGIDVSPDTIARELEKRDELDSNREISPLVQAPDARLLDTSSITIEEQTDIITTWANEKISQ